MIENQKKCINIFVFQQPLVAGGYLHTYRAFCSLLNIRPNRDVEMYVEDSAQQDNRHFVLDNIPGALSRDQTCMSLFCFCVLFFVFC